MRNAQQRLACEAIHNRLLNLGIRLKVDRARGFVADYDLRAAHEGAGEGKQLALPEAEVQAFLFHDAVEVDPPTVVLQRRFLGDEIGLAERGPELEVRVLVEGVEVRSDGAFEQRGVLGDDGELGPEVVESNLADVNAVDDNGATR